MSLSGKQKAAILLMVLGIDDASNVTQYMNQHDVRELADLASVLKNLSKDDVQNIMDEFMEGVPDGSELLSFDDDFSTEILRRSNNDNQFYSLDFLHRSDQKQLLEVIRHEHPQVIAFLLSYIQPEQSGKMLAQLSPEQQADIAHRISEMDKPNRMALKHLDRMMGEKMNFLTSSDMVEVGGVDSLVKIMRGVGRNAERVILENLETEYPELCDDIKSRMFVFEDITLLDNKNVQKVLKEVNMSTLGLALKKASSEIQDLIMRNLSERAKAVLLEDMQALGKVPLRDVEAAQQEIVETIRRMEESGEITIRKTEEVYV